MPRVTQLASGGGGIKIEGLISEARLETSTLYCLQAVRLWGSTTFLVDL